MAENTSLVDQARDVIASLDFVFRDGNIEAVQSAQKLLRQLADRVQELEGRSPPSSVQPEKEHPMNEDKAREAFEAWAKTKGTPEQGWWFRQLEDGGYSAGGPDAGWETWQAALQWAASQQAAEGWRPVAYLRNVANLPGLMVQWLPGQREQLRNGDRLYTPTSTQGGADEQR